MRQRPTVLVTLVLLVGGCAIEQDLTPRVWAGDELVAAPTSAPSPSPSTVTPRVAAPERRATPATEPSTEPTDTPTEPGPSSTREPGPSDPSREPDPSPQPSSSPQPDPSPSPEPRPNGDPVAADDTSSTDEDTAVAVPVLANDDDPDGDALTIVSISQPGSGTTQIVDGTVLYTPKADFHGTDGFGYAISDGRGGTHGAEVTVTVLPVNDAPVASGDGTYFVAAHAELDITDLLANDTDVDSDGLAIVAVTDGSEGVVEIVDDTTVRYTHQGAEVVDQFTYRISDGTTMSKPATVTIQSG